MEELPLEEFSKSNYRKRGYSYLCKDCHNKYVREVWYVKNAENQRAASKKWKDTHKLRTIATRYGMDFQLVKEAYEKNSGVCGSGLLKALKYLRGEK